MIVDWLPSFTRLGSRASHWRGGEGRERKPLVKSAVWSILFLFVSRGWKRGDGGDEVWRGQYQRVNREKFENTVFRQIRIVELRKRQTVILQTTYSGLTSSVNACRDMLFGTGISFHSMNFIKFVYLHSKYYQTGMHQGSTCSSLTVRVSILAKTQSPLSSFPARRSEPDGTSLVINHSVRCGGWGGLVEESVVGTMSQPVAVSLPCYISTT